MVCRNSLAEHHHTRRFRGRAKRKQVSNQKRPQSTNKKQTKCRTPGVAVAEFTSTAAGLGAAAAAPQDASAVTGLQALGAFDVALYLSTSNLNLPVTLSPRPHTPLLASRSALDITIVSRLHSCLWTPHLSLDTVLISTSH